MINTQEVLEHIPHFETFCSVAKLHGLADQLRADERFKVVVAGTSSAGLPIYHVRFGKGSVKALFLAYPHCMEPIGGLTAFSLMKMLQSGNPALLGADVEWHIVPCIDPDGALLNEGWTQKRFSFDNYIRSFYLQGFRDQADMSFPVAHKRLNFDEPSREAKILQQILQDVRPDFYVSLHNCYRGGAFFFISRDIGTECYREMASLLKKQNFPMQKRPVFREFLAQFAPGIHETMMVKKYYDYLEKSTPSPETLLNFGAYSYEYLLEIKPEALTLVTELGYVRHPSDESEKETGQNLRQFKLRLDADIKVLATIVMEEWEKVKADVDTSSPFFQVMESYALPTKDMISEGRWPLSRYPTRDVLFDPQFDKPMTEGDRFHACMVDGGWWSLFPMWSFQFLRLLDGSPQTPAIRAAIDRLEKSLAESRAEISRYVDLDAFEVVDCDTLARVQLGSSLIVLNSILEKRI